MIRQKRAAIEKLKLDMINKKKKMNRIKEKKKRKNKIQKLSQRQMQDCNSSSN